MAITPSLNDSSRLIGNGRCLRAIILNYRLKIRFKIIHNRGIRADTGKNSRFAP